MLKFTGLGFKKSKKKKALLLTTNSIPKENYGNIAWSSKRVNEVMKRHEEES